MITKLTRANNTGDSLRTTVPKQVIKDLGLENEMEWSRVPFGDGYVYIVSKA